MVRQNRKLAAIIAADIAGYSQLVGQDEEGTLRALKAHRNELIEPLISRYGGRIANTAGDSLLIEFASAVEALRCAVEIQRGMAIRNDEVPEERRIRFRVGINIGDVISEGDDLLGDGVNVAARLENIADAGGIYVSNAVREQVMGRAETDFDDLGYHKLKNIRHPVHIFRVHLPDTPEFEIGPGTFERPSASTRVVARGRCMCGAIEYEMDEAPFATILCHCRMCQRFNSAPFSVWTVFPEEAVHFIRSEPKWYTSSPIGLRGFCDECGSSLTMTYYAPDKSGTIAILTPTLDNPEDFPPTRHSGVESQLLWLDLNDGLPRLKSWEGPNLRRRWSAVGLPNPEDWK